MKNGILPARRLALLALAVMGFGLQSALAGTYTVTSNADDGSTGTLRNAINQENAAGSGQISINVAGVITLQSALPVITFSGAIFAYGTTTINGSGLYRPFFIDSGSGGSLSIFDLTITGGSGHGGNGGTGTDGGGGGLGAGGAVFVNSGAVTLSGVTTQSSSAIGGNGGSFNYSLQYFGGGGGGGLGGNGGNGSGTSTTSGAGGGGGGFMGNGGAGGVQIANAQYTFGGGGGGGGKYFDGGNGISDAGGGGGGSTSAGSPAFGGIGGDGGSGGGADGGADDSQTNNGNGSGFAGTTGGGGGGAGTSSKYTLAQNTGGNGGKFGGGGGANNGSGGAGGDFGGGGGAGPFAADTGGTGGFGGGGGGGDGTAGPAGFGGGAGGGGGGNDETGMGGAGGSAYGGAIFVRSNNGASIIIDDSSVDTGTLIAGTGGTNQTGAAGNGKVAGSSIFLPSGTTTFSYDNVGTIYGSMADDASDGNTASINKTGTGTLILLGANTYAGGTTISGGTIQIGTGGTAGSIVGNVGDNASLAFDRSDTVTFGGAISGSGSVTQAGTGTLMITNGNSYSGGTSVMAGTIDVVANNLPSGTISIAGGTTLAYDTGNTTVYQVGATITGAGTLEKIGSGSLVFGGNGVININLSSGAKIDVEAGAMYGSSNYQANWSSNYASLNVASGAIFDAAEGGVNSSDQFDALTGAGTLKGGWIGNPNATATVIIGVAGGGGTFSGPITDNANGRLAISKSGNGTEVFTGTDTYTGGTTINAGTLQIGNGGTSGSLSGNILNNTSNPVTFNRSSNSTYPGVISGAGGLTKTGAGTLTLTQANTYAGPTIISGGTLQLLPSSSAPAGYAAYYSFDNVSGSTVINGGSLGTTANATIGGTGTITSGGIHGNALSFPSTTAVLTPNATIPVLTSGSAHASTESAWFNGLNAPNLTRMLFGISGGDSEALLENTAGYALGDIIGGTQHSLGVDLAAYATGWHQLTVVQNEGPFKTTFYLDGQLAGSISNNFNYSDFNAFGNIATGGESFAQKLDDIYVYNNQSLSAAQVLQLYNSEFGGSLPTTTAVQLTASGATLDINGNTQSIASLTGVTGSNVLLGTGSLTVGSGNTATTFSGSISGAGSFTKAGTATLILDGTNSYSAGTTISAGTFQIGNGSTTGSIAGNVTDNSGLAFNRSDSYAFTGNISGTGSLTQNGPGTLTLLGTNIYSGATTISAGKLTIGSLAALANGAVTVKTGATLQFANTFHGTVVIPSLTVQSNANVDVAKTDLLINYTGTNPYAAALTSMKTAYDSGKWDGVGIRSSALIAGTSLAIYDNSISTKATFDGITADSTSVFIKYTWLGDANLDGIINSADLAAISSTGTTWQTGDFNYDTKVNADDYALFDLGSAISSGANISTTLPEPTVLSMATLAMTHTMTRRRQPKIIRRSAGK